MFGSGLTSYSSPLCSQSMMLPYDVPIPQPYPSPVPVPQPYIQNFVQPYDVPVTHTVQPVILPTPVGVPVPQPVPIPIDRPYAVPFPQPVAVPVDRPCAVPFPVHVPFPQPVPVPQPYVVQEQVPVPYPVPVAVPVQAPQQECYAPPTCRRVEYIIEEPVRIIRCRRRRRRRCRSYCSTPAPLPPIIIPIQMQAPAPQQAPSYQVIEYVQDIYPPAQVFTEQVPAGYTVKQTVIQQPDVIQNQQTSLNCQPGIILPSASYTSPSTQVQQQQIVRQLPNTQLVRRPLSVGGGSVQNVILRQPRVFSSNSTTLFSTPSFGTQFIS